MKDTNIKDKIKPCGNCLGTGIIIKSAHNRFTCPNCCGNGKIVVLTEEKVK